jgi:putative transposase
MRWYCYYHFVWATKNREHLIQAQMENSLFSVIRLKTMELHSQNRILAINAMPDHIHVAVMLYPNVTISHWIKRVKGASSHAMNTEYPHAETHFRWQRGYSVHTFGAKNSSFVISYIQNQKQHHAANTIEPYLEEVDDD